MWEKQILQLCLLLWTKRSIRQDSTTRYQSAVTTGMSCGPFSREPGRLTLRTGLVLPKLRNSSVVYPWNLVALIIQLVGNRWGQRLGRGWWIVLIDALGHNWQGASQLLLAYIVNPHALSPSVTALPCANAAKNLYSLAICVIGSSRNFIQLCCTAGFFGSSVCVVPIDASRYTIQDFLPPKTLIH